MGSAATSRSSSRFAPCSLRPPASIPRKGREAAQSTARCAQSSTGAQPSSWITRQQSLSSLSCHMLAMMSSAWKVAHCTLTLSGVVGTLSSELEPRARLRLREAVSNADDTSISSVGKEKGRK
eukprot:scaffold103815_cov28-Tisochrysis_lutea.AAC.4